MDGNLTRLKLPVRTVLELSGRLDEVCDILSEITKRTWSDFPVKRHITERGVVDRVSLKDVIVGIGKWYELIFTSGEHTSDEDANTLEALSFLIDSELEMKLHNYAVSCSHGNRPDDSELEKIRAYEVLNSSLDHFIFRYRSPDTDEFCGFYVPDGWCKVA